MVNLGRSKGCHTCKRRRIKCDEAKPICMRCAKSGFECAGYRAKSELNIRFKDQTKLVTRRCEPMETSPAWSQGIRFVPTYVDPPLSDNPENVALNFFLQYFVTKGRSLESTRGFFESIVPTLATAPSNSPIALAVSATATLLFNKWQRDNSIAQLSQTLLGQSLSGLQRDLHHPATRQCDATLLTILVLQFYENIRAVFTLKRVARTHQEGALALVRLLGYENFKAETSKRLLLHLLNTEVSSSIREKRRVVPDLQRWVEEEKEKLPWNPSSRLDQIGMAIAELQYEFIQPSSEATSIYRKAVAVQKDLSSWPESVPAHWRQQRWKPARSSDPPVPMYLGTCDVYPSIQIASIWNAWRGYHIILLNILGSTDINHPDLFIDLQTHVDSICYSVPFYLGNRTIPKGLTEAIDPNLVLPKAPEAFMSADDHAKHFIAIGTFNIVAPLSQLVTKFSQPHEYLPALSESLRPGELDWLRTQLLRIIMLLGLGRKELISNTSKNIEAERYAKKVRDGLRLTAGS